MTHLTVNGLNGNLYTPTPPDGNAYQNSIPPMALITTAQSWGSR